MNTGTYLTTDAMQALANKASDGGYMSVRDMQVGTQENEREVARRGKGMSNREGRVCACVFVCLPVCLFMRLALLLPHRAMSVSPSVA